MLWLSAMQILFSNNSICAETTLITPQSSDIPIELDVMSVEGRATDLLGIATSASQGVVGQPEFEHRPLARVGELVEVVPGTLATQHSGSGKANQFFLRGFNLDHGTDFSVMVDGIPMNMPTHAHGQGYLDLNSIIPELVDRVNYGKGPYYADVGDFSSAGYARMQTKSRLTKGIMKFTGGEFGYYRGVLANSHQLGPGELLWGGEVHQYDGVWQQPEDLGKYNGMLRYTLERDNWGLSVNGKAYHSSWTATNQIPERAIQDGRLNLYGSMDPSDGGKTNRYSLSSHIWSEGESYRNDINVYAVYTDLSLYSNNTGFLNAINGDQVLQKERRVQTGAQLEHTLYGSLLGFDMENTIGLKVRHDEIMGITLNNTQQRNFVNSVRDDDVSETSVGLFFKNETHWLEKFRSTAGLRADFFEFDVTSKMQKLNSGDDGAVLLSPKLSLIVGPWYDTELFLNMGYGYHSNDVRSATIQVDPVSNQAVDSVNPLVWSRGAEVGVRNQLIPGLTSTVALWWLQMNSELIFVGDSGTTEPSGSSERYGIEWTNYYQPIDWLTLDADLALTTARFRDAKAGEDHIPNSIGRVVSTGATIDFPYGFFATLRWRHFGHVPLTESGSVQAGDTNLINLGVGLQRDFYKVEVNVFNLLDSKDSDIAYFYNSRLPGEPAEGIEGVLKHPVEPRMVRVTATVRF